jgi:hypothetical protein
MKMQPPDDVWWNREPWWLGLLALPFLQIKHLIIYSAMQETRTEKIGVAIAMLPIFILMTVCWLTAWALVLGMVGMALAQWWPA